MKWVDAAAFRVGSRLGRYQGVRWTVAAFDLIVRLVVKVVRWCLIAAVFVGGVVIVVYLIAALNYAPLWFRVYNQCVDEQPEAAAITDALRNRSRCMRWASMAVEQHQQSEQQMKRAR